MRSIRRPVAATLGAFLAAAALTCPGGVRDSVAPAAPDNLPEAQVLNKDVDLGTVHAGAAKELSFDVRNNGAGPVTITGVRKTCMCRGVSFDHTKEPIPPGGAGKLKCRITFGPGHQSFRLFVTFSNGGADAISISYDGARPFALSASRVDWGTTLHSTQSDPQEIIIYGDPRYAGKQITLTHAGEKPEWIGYALRELPAPRTTGTLPSRTPKVPLSVIRFSTTDTAPPGAFLVVLRLRLTVDDEAHEFDIDCAGKVELEVYSTVTRLPFIGGARQPVRFRVCSAGRPFKVLDVRTTLGTCEFSELSAREAQLTFTLAAQAREETGALSIVLDHPTIREISIPITVTGD